MELTNLIHLVGFATFLAAAEGASGGTVSRKRSGRGYLPYPPDIETANTPLRYRGAQPDSLLDTANPQDAVAARNGHVVRRRVHVPEPPADETTWLLSMCKGFKLVDAMRGTDKEAGKLYVPERPVAQSRITDPDSKCDSRFPLAFPLHIAVLALP